jgi:hypothetical protein
MLFILKAILLIVKLVISFKSGGARLPATGYREEGIRDLSGI